VHQSGELEELLIKEGLVDEVAPAADAEAK
jgi:hypothetical protein